jgi:hypothetical protein
MGAVKEEPCLECALLVALQGDFLDKADICIEYGGMFFYLIKYFAVANGYSCSR